MSDAAPVRTPNLKARLPVAQRARQLKGFWSTNRWLILRRLSQAGVLALFLAGPLFGVWIVKGTLASSMTLNVLPLTDPFLLLQSLVARHWPEGLAIIGAAIVFAFYALVSGRAYCAWVCPINPVTDAAHWLHARLGLGKGWQPKPNTRYFVMGAVLAVSALTGTIAFELINPITAAYRAILFGGAWAFGLVAAVFLFDLFVSRRGWCSHLCPVGACYGLIGSKSLVRVVAPRREACDDCLDCYAVCPEPHVITPALRGAGKGVAPVILGRDCTACGRCIDVCSEDVFRFSHRFDKREERVASSAEAIRLSAPQGEPDLRGTT